jgi:hypothetical protein
MIIITNLCIGITFLFSIILIIDELYNVGFFTFNYTYFYNYGSFMAKFNTNQTIECETNRYNVYNNINFLFKDIYNKSYFNYLITIVIIIITILFSIAYGVYFYFRFIIEQPELCSFDIETDLSLPKQILKCLCDECHKIIPNCTSNYLIVFILIIIIPLSYILKVFLNINITPNTDNYLFSFMYLCVFILLLFYFSFSLYNRKTDNKYKDLIIYFFFTILFISSGYIHKYIISKYNNINLNTSYDSSTMYDIYKQAPPIKPTPIQKPTFNGSDLLLSFKYNDTNTDPEYINKKSIVDKYYKDIKNFDNDMKHYNQRFNAYTSSSLNSTTFSDKTDYLDIAINILGFNNNMHIYIIILTIIAYIIYSIYKDDTSYICFIYLLTILISITIMNSILYYNTYVNKYIIYEPMAHYKNDITNANTALNLELDAQTGIGFYNILVNNANIKSNTNGKNAKEIFAEIKTLLTLKNYTLDNTQKINTAITNLNQNEFTNISSDNNIQKIDTDIYYNIIGHTLVSGTITDKSIIYLLTNCVSSINTVSKNDIKIEPSKTLMFNFNGFNVNVKLKMTAYYRYVYYNIYQYNKLLENFKLKFNDYVEQNHFLDYLKNTDELNLLIKTFEGYKDTSKETHESLLNNIDTNITNTFKYVPDDTPVDNDIAPSSAELVSVSDVANTDEKKKNIYINLIQQINNFKSAHIKDKINMNILKTSSKIKKYIFDKVNYNIIHYSTFYIKNIEGTDYAIENTSSISITNDIITNTDGYNKLPNKISDSDNNELYISLLADKITAYIKYDFTDNFNDYKLISEYSKNAPIPVSSKINNYYPCTLVSGKTYELPFNLYKYKNNTNDRFKKIIRSVLLNNLCNVQPVFTNSRLLKSIGRKKIKILGNSDVLDNDFKYHNYFNPTVINLEQLNYEQTTLDANNKLLNITQPSNDEIISYIILLYNAYKAAAVDIKTELANKINYLIYNNKKYFDSTISTTTHYLDKIVSDKILVNIKPVTSKPKIIDDECIKLYNNNYYIITIIIQLYENLLLTIKAAIGNNESKLCLPAKTTLSDIETKIFDMYCNNTAIYTPTNVRDSAISSPAVGDLYKVSLTKTSLAPGDSDAKSIDAINKHYIYFNNIVKFLLDNLKLDNNSSTIATITSNYNFYNKEEIIKEPIRKQLIINCDYGSKYNKLDTKQLSYFQINANNVSYNFPILMVIFLIVLGEPAFIKS